MVGSGACRFRGEFNINVLDKSIVLVASTIFEESASASNLVARTDRRARQRAHGAWSSNCLRKSAHQGAAVQDRASWAPLRHGDPVSSWPAREAAGRTRHGRAQAAIDLRQTAPYTGELHGCVADDDLGGRHQRVHQGRTGPAGQQDSR